MIRILMFLIVSIGVFVGGLATSYFTLARPKVVAEAEARAEFGAQVPAVVSGHHHAEPHAAETHEAIAEVPPVIHQKPLSPEEVFRYTSLFREQQESLDRQKQSLAERQHRMKLIEEDMHRARLEIEGLRQETSQALKQGEDLIQRLQQEQNEFQQAQQQSAKEMEQFEKTKSEMNESEQANVKQVSRWFQSMPSDRAAEYLQELARDGKVASAVQLLSNIEERNAAKILAAVPDASLVVQLTEAFRENRRPEKSKK